MVESLVASPRRRLAQARELGLKGRWEQHDVPSAATARDQASAAGGCPASAGRRPVLTAEARDWRELGAPLRHVMAYLGPHDRMRALAVCRSWRTYAVPDGAEADTSLAARLRLWRDLCDETESVDRARSRNAAIRSSQTWGFLAGSLLPLAALGVLAWRCNVPVPQSAPRLTLFLGQVLGTAIVYILVPACALGCMCGFERAAGAWFDQQELAVAAQRHAGDLAGRLERFGSLATRSLCEAAARDSFCRAVSHRIHVLLDGAAIPSEPMLRALRRLVGLGTDVSCPDASGRTPLQRALQAGNAALCDILLGAGHPLEASGLHAARASAELLDVLARHCDAATASAFIASLPLRDVAGAVRRNDVALVRVYLRLAGREHAPRLVNGVALGFENGSACYLAARYERREMLDLLAAHGGDLTSCVGGVSVSELAGTAVWQ